VGVAGRRATKSAIFSRTFALHRILQRLADEALIRNSGLGCGGPHGVEELAGRRMLTRLLLG